MLSKDFTNKEMFRKKYDFLRQNFIFYLTGILVVLGIKFYYSQADCDSLLWILSPTTHWVEFLSKIPFTYVSGTGYVNHSLRLLIAPSCSGVQFMIITAATLIFSFVHNIASPQDRMPFKASVRIMRGFSWIAASLFISWLFTVLINGLRIIAAIYLPLSLEDAGLMKGFLTADRLHTMIGVVVYMIALLTIYRLVGYLICKKADSIGQFKTASNQGISDVSKTYRKQFPMMFVRKCLQPAFWYFFVTLGLPFLNRAYVNNTANFTEFAVLIICCAALILLLYFLFSAVRILLRKKTY